jgi:amidohydrolase
MNNQRIKLADKFNRATREAIQLRHQLHQIPELGFCEKDTSRFITRELHKLGITFQTGLAGGTGITALIKGSGAACVALRAEMDALPIVETTRVDWKSRRQGLMHACGHDGHMSIVLGAAAVLQSIRHQLPGMVKLIFQPAEEGLNGAYKMRGDGVLEHPRVQTIFGLHGWPEIPVGTVGFRSGVFLAAVNTLEIRVHGKGTHGAYPQRGIDPVVCGAALVKALSDAMSHHFTPTQMVVLTLGTFHAGTAPNIVPDFADLSGTLRTLNPAVCRRAKELILKTCRMIGAAYRCKINCRFISGTPATINTPSSADFFEHTAAAELGRNHTKRLNHPFLWSEDFAWYLQKAPGCFFVLGTRPTGRTTYPMLHSSNYDFPDSALSAGIRIMSRLAMDALIQRPWEN